MKKFIISTLILMVTVGNIAFAQCDKKVTFICSKTEYLDTTGTVQRTVDEKTTIDMSKSEILITPGEGGTVTGTVSYYSCKWTTPFKEGKTIIKATMTDEGGDVKHLTLTIEGKNGKVVLLADVEEMKDRRIRVMADTFEEKK